MYQGALEKNLDDLRFRFFEYINYIKNYVSGTTPDSLEKNELLSHLSRNLKLPKESIDVLIKILISDKKLTPTKEGNKVQLKPCSELVEQGKRRRFFTSIIDELIEKSKRVELLINHGGVIGSYRENLLINLFQRYLPSKFSISSGFIEGCNRQIDIIIFDSHNYIPLFKENNIVVVKIESVRAVIEVKSTLNSKELDQSLELLHDISRYPQPVIPIFKGVFAFRTTAYKNPKKIAEKVIAFYNKGSKTGWMYNKLRYLFQCIDSICVLNKMFVFSSHVYQKSCDEKLLLPYLSTVVDKYHFHTSGAYFLQRLFSFLDVEMSARNVNMGYFSEIENESDVSDLGMIHEGNWLESAQIVGGKLLTSEQDFKDRHNNVVAWMNGAISTHELVEKYAFGTKKPKDSTQS